MNRIQQEQSRKALYFTLGITLLISVITAAEQIGDLVVKFITKFKHYRVAICKIPNVKNGLYERDVNNKEINEYNKKINNIADQLNGEFQSCYVSALYYDLENTDIRHDGIHPNLLGNKKLVATMRNHLKRIGYNCSTNDVSLKKITPKLKDLFVPMRDGWINFNNRVEFAHICVTSQQSLKMFYLRCRWIFTLVLISIKFSFFLEKIELLKSHSNLCKLKKANCLHIDQIKNFFAMV